ncbi:MAG: GNAT family N-acetyltransferase [Caulobacteraceae bacterium]
MTTPAILEPIAERAWPARESARVGEWRLNASDGWSGRINSCRIQGAPDRPFGKAIDMAEAWFAERGLAPIFKLILGREPDVAGPLIERGYEPGAATLVMTGRPGALADRAIRIEPTIGDSFRRVFSEGQFGAAEDAAERLGAFERTSTPRGFAVLEDHKVPTAIGVTAVDATWFGVMGMRTLVAHRRKGFGRRILRALCAFAAGEDAQLAWLQVMAGNEPALDLYRSEGFSEAYRYRYWRKRADLNREPGEES